MHPDGTGALKKRQAADWKVTRRVDDKNPSAGPRCWYGNSFSTVPWQLSCCAGRRSLVERHRLPFSWPPNDYGSSRWRRHDSTAGCRLDVLCCCSSQIEWPWSLGVWPRAVQKRNEVELLFSRLKGFGRIFSRFDQLDLMFSAFLFFVLIVDSLR